MLTEVPIVTSAPAPHVLLLLSPEIDGIPDPTSTIVATVSPICMVSFVKVILTSGDSSVETKSSIVSILVQP